MLSVASLPKVTDAQQRDILSIRVVSRGVIEIEATAEIYDLWHQDLRFLYPHLDGKFTIAIHDVAPTILSTFDKSLGDYALESASEGCPDQIRSAHRKIEQDAIYTKEEGLKAYGMLLWATRNGVNPRVEDFPRILTDKYLRVLRPDGLAVDDAYALGDAADIDGHSLPTLAEVALQKGECLSSELDLNYQPTKPSEYKQRALMAYLGQHRVVGGRSDGTGESAWLSWRSGSLAWTKSWRRSTLVLVWFSDRDIARK